MTDGLYAPLLSDGDVAGLFSAAAQVRDMIAVEVALAEAEAGLGVIPQAAAATIASAAVQFQPDIAALATATGTAGVPVIELLRQFRGALGDPARYLHYGATSQDIIDTALMIALHRAVTILDTRIAATLAALAGLADDHRNTLMLARTRGQPALPMTFGLKAANWAAPLARHRTRLADLRPRVFRVQLGGAAGTLAALSTNSGTNSGTTGGTTGLDVADALAQRLDLHPALPWHSQRDAIAELAGWLSMVTTSLGKIGADLLHLVMLGEVTIAGGGSSTMPHKNNPVAAETLVTLAHYNAGQLSSAHTAGLHADERGGAAWQLEPLTLPAMAEAAAAALRHAGAVLSTLTVNGPVMRRNIDATNGVVMAEAARLALAAHVPAEVAAGLVAEAAAKATAGGANMIDTLAASPALPAAANIDWAALRDPASYLGMTAILIDRTLRDLA